MISRRELLKYSGQAVLASQVVPLSSALLEPDVAKGSVRCVNVVNFLRGVEPRGPMDLFLPLQKQMETSLAQRLPTTWLLQFDALVSGPFVEYLKAHMTKDHEVGVWFEMNEMHCRAAGVEWRGRPGYEWDHYPSVAFTIGYSPDERIKLADAFMREFKRVWGVYPKSVASWNLDSITMAHLTAQYDVDAYAVCRDQIATDGFTIWGAPIAGYYPSTLNCWSPALDRKSQIATPVFRMLGQDPVYYYESGYPMSNGRRGGGPDTMEPVWPSGRSPRVHPELPPHDRGVPDPRVRLRPARAGEQLRLARDGGRLPAPDEGPRRPSRRRRRPRRDDGRVRAAVQARVQGDAPAGSGDARRPLRERRSGRELHLVPEPLLPRRPPPEGRP